MYTAFRLAISIPRGKRPMGRPKHGWIDSVS